MVLWPGSPVPRIDMFVTMTSTPAMTMAMDVLNGNDFQWMQGTLDSGTNFAVEFLGSEHVFIVQEESFIRSFIHGYRKPQRHRNM